ncbi:hypothetical protein SANTM175S_07267 [Streptomyces antimycoticus]
MGLPLRATKASCVRGLVAGAVATLVLAALGCQQTDGGQGQAGTRSSPAHSAHATTATSARPPSTTPPHGTAASAPPRTVPSVREFTPTTGPGWRPGERQPGGGRPRWPARRRGPHHRRGAGAAHRLRHPPHR